MHADPAEVLAEARLKESTRAGVKWASGRTQHFMHKSRHLVGFTAPVSPPREIHFCAGTFLT
jgi:hypothetical protein